MNNSQKVYRKWLAQIADSYGGPRHMLRHYYFLAWYSVGMLDSFVHVDWSRPKRLVYVCKGNICRSPYAELFARKNGAEAISFGLRTTDGLTANESAIKNASVRGVDIHQHRTSSLDEKRLGQEDLIIGMEPWHGDALLNVATRVGAQVTLLGLWTRDIKPYIFDPYGLEDRHFQRCFSIIETGVLSIIKQIKDRQHKSSIRVTAV